MTFLLGFSGPANTPFQKLERLVAGRYGLDTSGAPLLVLTNSLDVVILP